MNSTDESNNLYKFFHVNNKLDTIRDESFEKVFPELYLSLNTALQSQKKDKQ
jgi:hypothetical protein